MFSMLSQCFLFIGLLLTVLTVLFLIIHISGCTSYLVNYSTQFSKPFLSHYDIYSITAILNKWAYMCFIFAFLMSLFSFIFTDLSVLLVVEHSHKALPLIYKLSGLWSNHEGSLLLWIFLTYPFIWFYINFINKQILYYKPNKYQNLLYLGALFVINSINGLFILFMIYSSNPAITTFLYFNEGAALSPTLQDPILAIHPPCIYIGYVGLIVPAILCGFYLLVLSILILRKQFTLLTTLLPQFIMYWQFQYKQVVSSWLFLTFGIGLGSWWAYYELGWGGWWFWDPVENMSLLPWLCLLLSIHICFRFYYLFTYLYLVLFALFFGICGTFLVRSGFFESVHSFALSTDRGFWLLCIVLSLFSFVCFVSLSIYVANNTKTKVSSNFVSTHMWIPWQMTTLVHIFVVCCVAMILIVIIGTITPGISWKLFSVGLSIGSNYYSDLLLPIFYVLLILLYIFTYEYTRNRYIYQLRLLIHLLTTLLTVSALCIYLMYIPYTVHELFILVPLFIICAIILLLWYICLILSLICLVFFTNTTYLNKYAISMFVSHFGFACFGLGTIIYGYGAFVYQNTINLNIHLQFNDICLYLLNYNYLFGATSIDGFGSISITNWVDQYSIFFPEKRYYTLQTFYSTKPYIITNIVGDFYLLLQEGQYLNGWDFKLLWNPGMSYIWVGLLCMVVSCILMLLR